MSRRKVSVTLELPVEAAELLVEHGPAIIKALSELVGRARAQHIEIDPPEVRAQRLAARKRVVHDLGRQAYRIVRRLIRATGKPALTGKSQLHQERELLDVAAWELRQDALLVKLAFQGFRKSIKARIRARRKREVARLFLQGQKNGEIAARLGVSMAVVIRDIHEFREAAKTGFAVKRQKPTRPGSPQPHGEKA